MMKYKIRIITNLIENQLVIVSLIRPRQWYQIAIRMMRDLIKRKESLLMIMEKLN